MFTIPITNAKDGCRKKEGVPGAAEFCFEVGLKDYRKCAVWNGGALGFANRVANWVGEPCDIPNNLRVSGFPVAWAVAFRQDVLQRGVQEPLDHLGCVLELAGCGIDNVIEQKADKFADDWFSTAQKVRCREGIVLPKHE